MGQAELLIAGLLVAVAGLSALARRLQIPYPIVLVIGGALFGFVPGLPEVTLDPDVVLVVFLPPLLYSAAFFANLGDLRRDLRAISITVPRPQARAVMGKAAKDCGMPPPPPPGKVFPGRRPDTLAIPCPAKRSTTSPHGSG